MKIPFVKAMPYHLSQDMSSLLFEQNYLPDEIIYDVGERNCDTLYFVIQGRIKVQAKVTIEKQTTVPVGANEWVKNVQNTEVYYFIKQLSVGQYFGLEELIEIGLLKYSGQENKKD